MVVIRMYSQYVMTSNLSLLKRADDCLRMYSAVDRYVDTHPVHIPPDGSKSVWAPYRSDAGYQPELHSILLHNAAVRGSHAAPLFCSAFSSRPSLPARWQPSSQQ